MLNAQHFRRHIQFFRHQRCQPGMRALPHFHFVQLHNEIALGRQLNKSIGLQVTCGGMRQRRRTTASE